MYMESSAFIQEKNILKNKCIAKTRVELCFTQKKQYCKVARCGPRERCIQHNDNISRVPPGTRTSHVNVAC